MTYLIDTHAHLDMAEDIDSTIKNAHDNNVRKIIIPSVEEKYFDKVIKIAENHENIFCQLGIFPSEAKTWTDEIADKIRQLAKHSKVVAIGEVGLDYYWDKSFIEEQKEMFKKQITLANELNLPIVVHDREAHKDSIDILKEYNKDNPKAAYLAVETIKVLDEYEKLEIK